MMKKISVIVLLFFMLMLVPTVLAGSTKITIRTGPGFDVQMMALDPITGRKIVGGEFFGTTDTEGEYTVNYTTDEKLVHLSFIIKDQNDIIVEFQKKPLIFEKILLGGSVYIDLRSSDPEPVVDTGYVEVVSNQNSGNTDNQSETNASANASDVNASSSFTTGYSVFGEEGSTKRIIIYSVVGGVVILIIILIVFFAIRKKSEGNPKSPFQGQYVQPQKAMIQKPATQKPIQPTQNSAGEALQRSAQLAQAKPALTQDQELEDAERKLMQAQKEIANIKERKGKISEAKRKLEADRAELERLKGL